jgi:hypothetical protein
MASMNPKPVEAKGDERIVLARIAQRIGVYARGRAPGNCPVTGRERAFSFGAREQCAACFFFS